jgi:cell division transport system permease protein
MKSIKLFRTFNEGVQNYRRDRWLTMATVMVMTLALYLIGVSFFLGFGILSVMTNIEDRINVSINFNFDVPEEKILEIQQEIEDKKISEIKAIRYISREEAFTKFKEQEKDNKDIMGALEILEDNPFPASLVITAKKIKDYKKIDEYLKKEYSDKIMSTNHDKNQQTINELHNFILFVRNIGLALGIILIIIATLVNFNTVRMSLYVNRKEFEIMRLVGASNLYVKLPTVFEGFLYGLTSALVTIIFLMITIYASDPFIRKMLPDVKIAEFYTSNIIIISLILLMIGVFLGTVSSYIAVRRYLEK